MLVRYPYARKRHAKPGLLPPGFAWHMALLLALFLLALSQLGQH